MTKKALNFDINLFIYFIAFLPLPFSSIPINNLDFNYVLKFDILKF